MVTPTPQTDTGPGLSRRVSALQPSVTVAFGNRAKAMKRDGIDVLSFSLGEPDFDTPQAVKQAAIDALLAGQTKYMPTLGDPETRQCIADKLGRENGIGGLTGEHVAISCGGKHVLYSAAQCMFDPEQLDPDAPRDAIIPVPAWVSYDPIVRLAGGNVVELPTTALGNFKITPAQLEAAITPKTRAIFLNSPSNPCGTMYSPDEIRALAAVIESKLDTAPGMIVISDEIYEKIIYGGDEHLSIGSIDSIADRVLTVNGLSKAYSMTGWRIGYAAMPGDFGKKFIKAMGTLQGQMTTNITSFNYPAIRTALTDDSVAQEVEAMRTAFAKRAEVITERLSDIPGLVCPKPTGAFYAFPDVSAYFGKTTPAGKAIDSALDMCNALLEDKHIAFVPGEDFGGPGASCVRISFACSEDQINEGMDRFRDFLSELS
ncbi:MAG: pyridoxal phosphate-dependent aminotransferase [Planctomycetota bacterium]